MEVHPKCIGVLCHFLTLSVSWQCDPLKVQTSQFFFAQRAGLCVVPTKYEQVVLVGGREHPPLLASTMETSRPPVAEFR